MKRPGIRFALLIAATFFSTQFFAAPPASPHATENFNGREILLYVPTNLPAKGTRALVVVLHGGLGNASRIEGGQSESGLRMDSVADKDGFIVAYLNGTKVARMLGANMLGWNAGGGCCGVPAETNVDDVGYISNAVNHLISEYGIDPTRVYGIGHSNGAMMSMRMICETNLYAAVISIAGPLNLKVKSCPAAKGNRILSLHGADDQNVPIAGGVGSKGISQVAYASEADTQHIFAASGANFRLQIVPGADHFLDNIDKMIEQAEHVTIAEKAAQFFGLAAQGVR